MIIVKRRGDIIRFFVFVAAVGLVVYFVASRWDAWHVAWEKSLFTLQPEEMAQEEPGAMQRIGELEPGGVETPSLDMASGSHREEDFFAEFRMTRDRSRSAHREALREVMENPAVGPEAQEAAGEEYLALGRYASLESQAEALVRARGFADAVVHISGDSAQVVVKTETLTQQEAAQVADTVSRVTGVKAGAVQVMARER